MADLEQSAPKRRRTEEGGDGEDAAPVAVDGHHDEQQGGGGASVSSYLDMIGTGKRALEEILTGFQARGVDVEGTLQDILRHKIDNESCKLFVRSLSWNTSKEQVREVYEKFGEIKEITIVERDGKSRGFGFVTYTNALDAVHALEQKCKKIDGRDTYCNLASRPDEGHQQQNSATPSVGGPSPGMSMGGGGGGAMGGGSSNGGPIDANGMTQDQKDRCRLFIRSLDWNTNEETLRIHFEKFGNVLDCAVIKDKDTGKSKGYGFITFASPQEAQEALRDRQKQIDGRTTHCNLASDRKRPNTSLMPSTIDPSQTMYQNHMQQYMQQLQMQQQQQYYQQQQMAAMGQQAAVDPTAAAAAQQQAAFGYPQQQAAVGQQWAAAAVAQPAVATWGQQPTVATALGGAPAQPQFGFGQ